MRYDWGLRGATAQQSTLSLCSKQLGSTCSPMWASHGCVLDFLFKKRHIDAASQCVWAREGVSLTRRIASYPRNWTAMHLSAYFGIQAATEVLLDHIEPNSKDSKGQTPISYAAMNDHLAVVRFLAGRGADITANDREKSPLLGASRNGHLKVVEYLVGFGADVTIHCSIGKAAIWTSSE
ncbi:ankyrin repeat-containing domain protein [Dactylonectria macrodidyma]|uniref:Ankyrin repeat-containing domain protein n=1 Tax=Dactylonectria macrodidyma TaxID=307937 RepID=A0A9P9EBP6_9HYPO|nr:ankyrin repeat-containing domain protein [Dactylonectria macrodidyma]